jgi:hypothetical protein
VNWILVTQEWAPRAGFYDDGDELSGAAEYNLPKERISTILLYIYDSHYPFENLAENCPHSRNSRI